MKWSLLPLMLLIALASCKKKSNDTLVTFSVNGTPCSFSGDGGNAAYVAYTSGTIDSYLFTFNGSHGDNLSFAFYSVVGFQPVTGWATDSLIPGNEYQERSTYYSTPAQLLSVEVTPTATWHIYLTITKNDGKTLDGTFSGLIVGEDALANDKSVTDSISNGVFKNIPISRTFD
ncbi:hypothetical protein [Dinghuibacter silviterrae]|uniref:Uncharacterized protein n=1 Tax=Dinghuibacter silviterrae TaxID=1539049 RepID=A0A4R8DW80_9BACT|nr:hypothetical protein [Dinghuibacter silviterrae]TDX02326.1 hypothetical protein EDB95_3382 [Dinghuibacter silviterrae]